MLDTPGPTLAEYLASRGYQTAGFAANTNCCNYETGLARGFAHFEDFPLTPRSLLGRTVPGNWILKNILYHAQYHDMKWIGLQSRGARGTSEAFLGWLRRRRPDRPFFAFLNYFDAHAPYIPPPGFQGRFGIRPRPPRDYEFLLGNMAIENNPTIKRDVQLARDCYDDCIAFLDQELGRLLDDLRGQKLLDNTVVIITSDHGEAFGDHGHFGHTFSLYLDVVGVPLVILSPGAPAGQVVDSPVSLRDLPATVVDQLGLSASSPFPGHSLAAHWRTAPGQAPQGTTARALSEQADPIAFEPQASECCGPRPPRSCRCPWWPRAIITFGMEWGPRYSTISGMQSVRARSTSSVPSVRRQSGASLPPNAPRSVDRQPRLDRGGKGLFGVFQARAQSTHSREFPATSCRRPLM